MHHPQPAKLHKGNSAYQDISDYKYCDAKFKISSSSVTLGQFSKDSCRPKSSGGVGGSEV